MLRYILACLLAFSASAQTRTGTVQVRVSTDHSDWRYQPGQPVRFHIVAVQDGRQAPDRATLSAIAAAVDAVPAHEEDVASVLSQDILRVRRGRQRAPAARRRTIATLRAHPPRRSRSRLRSRLRRARATA